MLGRATKWFDEQRRELNGYESEKLRIPSKDKGIAHVIKDLSNPHLCDPKAGALPGCATPRQNQSGRPTVATTSASAFLRWSSSRTRWNALARWLITFFCSADSSASVAPSSGT